MTLPTTIKEASELIEKKEVSPVELTKSFLDRIDSKDKELNSFITVLDDKALESASNAESEIIKGNYKGPLHGVPLGLKDIFVMKDVRATCGSKILENFKVELKNFKQVCPIEMLDKLDNPITLRSHSKKAG